MFKPYYGYCKFCDKDDRLIAVKSLHCQKCNYELKQAKKKQAGKKEGRYVYKRVATGEASVFKSILENMPETETRCFVCNVRVAVITPSNMAHVLPKGKYAKMRLDPNNIRILCHRLVADNDGNQGCHFAWDMKPRSELTGEGWERMKELEHDLKEIYKTL